MSNHEIEDVLSSIRRLVSEDLRPISRATSAAKAAVKPADKLLLTPALRVVGAAEGEGIAQSGVDRDPKGDAFADTFVARASSLQETPSLTASTPARGGPDVANVITGLGAVVAEEDWESPFGDVGDLPDAGWAGLDRDSVAQDADDVTRDESALPEFVHHPRVGERRREEDNFIAAPEAAFAADEDIVSEASASEATFDAQDDAADTAWADQAEAAVMADLAQDVEAEAAAAGAFTPDAGGEMVFDEQVLRDLVRDLIREELAGSLGERITRNVRKLVRAEIARAMTAREFE